MYNLIEDYLDRLCLPLVHRLPYHERQRIRQELRDHLLERVNELKSQGVSDDEAVLLALKGFGSPEWVGTLILEKHTPLPRLNWWRAIVLLVVVAVGSYALVLANYRLQSDIRQPRVVDVMLWTAGDKAVRTAYSIQQREALYRLQQIPIITGDIPLPPLSTVRPVQEPSLRPLEQTINRHYGMWYMRVQQAESDKLSGQAYIEELLQRRYNLGVRRVLASVPVSVCATAAGGCMPRGDLLPPAAVALQVGATMMVSATVAGLLMRRMRWVAATAVAVALFSLVWSGALAMQLNAERANNRFDALAPIVQSLERLASQQPRLLQSSPEKLPLAQLGLRNDTERQQRILQLARLYRLYEADYQRLWNEWARAGIVSQTWRMLRATALPSWWVVPVALAGIVVGGWLGIHLGIWVWRVRSYLVYRYV